MLRIVIIDEQAVFRAGLNSILAGEAEFAVVGEAGDAREGFLVVDRIDPDLVIMALQLPGMDGLAATRELRRRSPELRVLLLGAHPDVRDVLGAFGAGALGYALKSDSAGELLAAIRTVGAGARHVSPAIRRFTTAAPGAREPEPDVLASLSTREREVFDLVIRGFKNRQIARELCISIKTVDSHRTRINEKLGCASTVDVVLFAARNGLLKVPALDRDRSDGPPRPAG